MMHEIKLDDRARARRLAEIRARRETPERVAAIARLAEPRPVVRLSATDRDHLRYITTELHPSAKHVERLRAEFADACSDATADFGAELVEAGGYFDLAQSVIAMHPECSPATIAEFKRIEGV